MGSLRSRPRPDSTPAMRPPAAGANPGDREDSPGDFAAASASISMVASRNRWGRGYGGVRRAPWRPEESEERFSSDAMAVDPVRDCRERRPAWH
jgi:hypothetical protein